MIARSLLLVLLASPALAQPVPPPAESTPVVVPVPDPTVLTTEQLVRALAQQEKFFLSVIDGIKIRLDAGDKAITLLQETTDRQPQRTEAAVNQLKSLADEKFMGVQQQFEERDVRTEQLASATEKAVVNALAAQDKSVTDKAQSAAEAIAKSEASTAKQIDGLSALIAQGNNATNSKIDDLKARVQAIESRSEGPSIQKEDTAGNWGLVFGAVGMVIGVGAVFAAFLTRANAPALVNDPGPTRRA
jgi:hypothetical protein